MSEWTPKVGDKVMVGEHGPYEVAHRRSSEKGWVWDLYELDRMHYAATLVPTAWLTPAPEPEPDEPTAPGALVRFGESLAVQRGQFSLYGKPWLILTGPLQGSVRKWSELTAYPITVVLADPAEVERQADLVAELRKHVEAQERRAEREKDRADELQRRIDRALAMRVGVADEWTDVFYKQGAILRGKS